MRNSSARGEVNAERGMPRLRAKAHALGGNGEIFGGNAAINRAIGLIFRGGAGKKHNGRRVVKNVVARPIERLRHGEADVLRRFAFCTKEKCQGCELRALGEATATSIRVFSCSGAICFA